MFPVFMKLPFFTLYTFGIFLLLAFFLGSFLFWKLGKLTSVKEEELFDGLFISIMGGLFTSRLVYVLLNFSNFGFNPLKFILINGFPGLSLFGALFGGVTLFYVFTRVRRIHFLEIIDYMVAPLFAALSIGKIGSFIAGVDVGTRTKFILSTPVLGISGKHHITALYEALFFVIGCFIAYRILFVIRRAVIKQGTAFMFFIWYFGLVNLFLDNLKVRHVYLAGLSVNLIASLIMSIVGTLYFLIIYRETLVSILTRFIKIRTYGKTE